MDVSRREAITMAAAAGLIAASQRAAAQTLPAIVDGSTAIARARTAIGLLTRYQVGGDLPPAEGWRCDRERTDCSGLILWSFGLGRSDPRLGPAKVTTDNIYDDAVGPHRLFRQTPRPEIGGIVIYPRYDVGDGIADFGHVGIISRLRPVDSAETGFAGSLKETERFAVIDCSGSAYRIFGDAVRENDYLKFLLHDEIMTKAKRLQPHLDPKKARSPIFAVSVAAAEPAAKSLLQPAPPVCTSNSANAIP